MEMKANQNRIAFDLWLFAKKRQTHPLCLFFFASLGNILRNRTN